MLNITTQSVKTRLHRARLFLREKISDHFKLFGMFEGSQDELELIVESQIHVNKNIYFKIGSGFGITPKATDIAPEIGVMFSYRFGGEE